MQSDPGPSRGALRVALLALHDKRFFAYLLEQPRAAMEDKVREGTLELSESEMRQVEELIRKQRLARPDQDPMVMWTRYKEHGLFVPGEDWMELWKEM
jgi:hypothetical protein